MIKLLHAYRKPALFVLLCIFHFNVHAVDRAGTMPEKVISGKVIGEDGAPLPGVNVLVKGTQIGTATDKDGAYKLAVPDDATTLVFTYIGYLSQEVVIGSQTTIDIALAADVANLEEVVVVGYGEQRKSDLTGSVSSVKGEDLVQLPVQRADQALQGRAAGVSVMNTDGSPGGNTTIRVRGSNSVNGSNAALIVIDGLQGGNLNSLNPNDIESIEVLKDASATAIYGSQGANGVILVTTKKGKKGKPMINYNYSLGGQNLIKKIDVMNAADFATTTNAFRATQNTNGTPTPVFTDAQIAGFKKNGGTDWQDQVYRQGVIQNHQLSISGASDNVSYLVSTGYLNQKGILINSAYERFSLRANVNVDINKWSKFGLSLSTTKEKGNSPPFGEGVAVVDPLGQVTGTAPRWDAATPVYDANGNYTLIHPALYGAANSWNPVASARESFVENNTYRNTMNAFLEFKLLKGLTFRVTGGAIIENTNNFRYYNSQTLAGASANGGPGAAQVNDGTFARYQNSNILTYDRKFDKHHLTITGVGEQQIQRTTQYNFNGSNFLVDATGVNDFGGAGLIVATSSVPQRVLNSYLGRVNYAFNEKYLITASYRADGSSVFGKNNKWGYFPSVAGAWRAVEEPFIKNLNIFSDLKLRGSWGITGNQAIQPYQTLAQLASGNKYPWDGSSSTNSGYAFVNAPNPNLKWESTTQTDIGFDLSIFNGRLNVTADYYTKTTRDLLLAKTLPAYTGYASIIDNVGTIQNKGIEFSINGDPFVGAFKWNTGFNISANRNKVLDLGETNTIPFATTSGAGYNFSGSGKALLNLTVGQPIGQMLGYGYLGTWKTSEAELAAKYGQLPGDAHYEDVNHDFKINSQDVKVIGHAFPKFIFGWNNRISYKNLDLNMLIQGVHGNNIFNAGRIRLEAPGEGTSTNLLNRWTPTNQNTDVPAFTDAVTRNNAGLTSTVAIRNDNRSARWVEDGSYIRLKNITLGYTFPKSILNNVGISRFRMYVAAANILTITKYTGYDPETSSFNSTDTRMGIDFSNYPTAKTYTFGVDLTF